MGEVTRLRAAVGLAVRGLHRDRLRTVLAVVGVAIAVLAVTLLAGGGMGVLAFGESQFEAADRDLWVTGGPIGLTPAGGGGLENSIHDAHGIAGEIESHEDVDSAVPLLFQRVYVGPDGSGFETTIATGVPGGGGAVDISDGTGFSGDTDHYANGTYEGNMSHEALVDDRFAEAHNLSVGDTVNVGGTLTEARANEFEIVGISPTYAEFLGTSTVTIPLSELQTVTGSTGMDPATLVTVTVEDDVTPEAVQSDLEDAHPELQVNTNREQLEEVLAHQASVVAGASVLVLLAVVAGAGLTASLLSAYVYQHRRQFATLLAVGVSRRTLGGIVVARGLALGLVGWVIGVAVTVPMAMGVNEVVEGVTGYPDLVVVTSTTLLAGGAVALGIGAVTALIAAWRMPSGLS